MIIARSKKVKASAKMKALIAVVTRLEAHAATSHGIRHCAECQGILAAARVALKGAQT